MISVTEATKIETLKPGYNSTKSVPISEVCENGLPDIISLCKVCATLEDENIHGI